MLFLWADPVTWAKSPPIFFLPIFQLFWNKIIMHWSCHGFIIAGSHPLNLQGLCLPPPGNLGCFQCKGMQLQCWAALQSTAYTDFFHLNKNTPNEVSTADKEQQPQLPLEMHPGVGDTSLEAHVTVTNVDRFYINAVNRNLYRHNRLGRRWPQHAANKYSEN